ncbi:hypothetical protein AcV7_010455 [Taiwanofungus camphoratus]|nr:hypothetical protein AcV7_010455 [Antrodia cinnamomea]
MWCDFNFPSIQLVSHLNITPPGTPPVSPTEPRPSPSDRGPGTGRGSRPRRSWGMQSPLAIGAFSGWIRAAAHRGHVPQSHVHLHYASFVTFYHPRLHSLTPARVGQSTR